MLVLNERADAPYSEKVVAGWLRSCHVPGVAIAGGYVPGRGHRARGQEADFIVFTPNLCVCIEVKGTLSRTGGVLSCPVNGRWSMPGFPGDPVHVRTGDVNPLNQARSAMFSLKSITASVTRTEQFVSALVVVVPLGGTVVTLNKAPKRFMPTGIDVLLGDRPHELFGWFQRGKSRASVWTVKRVGAMLDALGINDPAASPQALAAEGFPATTTAPTTTPSRTDDPYIPQADPFATSAPASPASPDPGTTREPSPNIGAWSSSEERYDRRPNYTPAGYRPPVIPAPPGQRPPFPPVPAPTEPHRGRARIRPALMTVAVLIVVGLGVWYSTGAHSRHDSTSRPDLTTVTAPPPVLSAPPAPAQLAPMTTARPCYPLQPDC